MNHPTAPDDYDVLVIGSGFGGAVTALRLTEKGYRVGVLEAGRRFEDADLPRTSWDARKFLWAPKLGCTGIQRIHMLRDVIILAGAGVGGGSLVYANTLYRPRSDAFYHDRQWADITDWRAELAPYYDQAERMLGVVREPDDDAVGRGHEAGGRADGRGGHVRHGPGRRVLRPGRPQGARRGGRRPVLRRRGPAPPRLPGGRGMHDRLPAQREEHAGEELPVPGREGRGDRASAETTAVAVRPLERGGYAVDTVRTGAWRAARTARSFTAGQVVFAAGTWGTQQLLHRMKAAGSLPGISDRLACATRTNSEALGGALTKLRNRKQHDFTARGGHHLVDPPGRPHPHRARPLRQGLERDGAAQHADDRRRRADAALGEVAGPGRAPSGAARVPLRRPQPLVRAGRDRAHHADRSTTRSRFTPGAPGSAGSS